MNKRLLAITVLLAALGAAAFASPRSWTAYSGAPITLTGKVDLQEGNPFVVLRTGSGVWSLMIPEASDNDLALKNGDSLSVTGFETYGPRGVRGNGVRFLMVQKATIAGKEYAFSDQYGPNGGYGPHSDQYGPDGGYGRYYGYGPGMMGWMAGRWGSGRGWGSYDGPDGYAGWGGCGW